MKRVRLTVAYDGTAYHGWQLQQNGNTIEAELNRAISDLTGEEIRVIGASRTDAGVHAYGNVAVFDTETRIPAEKIAAALNVRLPGDIRVQRSGEVPADWHPRHQDCRKTYEYHICVSRMEIPTMRLYAHYMYKALDTKEMNRAAKFLVGEHDFTSFCAAESQATSMVRTLFGAVVEERRLPVLPASGGLEEQTPGAGEIIIRVCGNGFLYNMVRIIAGTLVDVGLGRKKAEDLPQIIEAKDRRAAGPTLPAQGLFLMGYEYPDEEAR